MHGSSTMRVGSDDRRTREQSDRRKGSRQCTACRLLLALSCFIRGVDSQGDAPPGDILASKQFGGTNGLQSDYKSLAELKSTSPEVDTIYLTSTTSLVENKLHSLGVKRLEDAQIDAASGEIASIVLKTPIIPHWPGERRLEKLNDGNEMASDHSLEPLSDQRSSLDDRKAQAKQAMRAWLSTHSYDLNIDTTEIYSNNIQVNHLTDPNIRFEDDITVAIHNSGDLIQMHFPRYYKGVPVLQSHATASIKNGNLVHFGLEHWPPIRIDTRQRISPEKAWQVLERHLGDSLHEMGYEHLSDVDRWCNPELHVSVSLKDKEMDATTRERRRRLGQSGSSTQPGEGYEQRLIYRLCPRFSSTQRYEAHVDAHTSDLYLLKNTIQLLSVQGGGIIVGQGISEGFNDVTKERSTDKDDLYPMPFMDVTIDTGERILKKVSDVGGQVGYFGNGTVTARLEGPYVKTHDECGTSLLTTNALTGVLDWGSTPSDSTSSCATPPQGGKGNTHSSRINFYELNMMMEMARSHLPENAWLNSQVISNTNLDSGSCNAYWDGESVNFYVGSDSCNNAGEIASVVAHEWGHGEC